MENWCDFSKYSKRKLRYQLDLDTLKDANLIIEHMIKAGVLTLTSYPYYNIKNDDFS